MFEFHPDTQQAALFIATRNLLSKIVEFKSKHSPKLRYSRNSFIRNKLNTPFPLETLQHKHFLDLLTDQFTVILEHLTQNHLHLFEKHGVETLFKTFSKYRDYQMLTKDIFHNIPGNVTLQNKVIENISRLTIIFEIGTCFLDENPNTNLINNPSYL